MQRVAVGPVWLEVVAGGAAPPRSPSRRRRSCARARPLHSSARNSLAGRVVRIAEQGAAVRVTIDAGVELIALVTRRSYDELGLAIGAPVHVSFKSVAVRVF